MVEPRRITMNVEPQIIERLGDNTYYYNYDIIKGEAPKTNMREGEPEEMKTVWSYIQVHLNGVPNSSDCVRAVIKKYVTIDEEMNILNKYSKYQLGLSSDASDYDNYYEYVELLSNIKTKVKKDFNIEVTPSVTDLIPSQKDISNLLQMVIETFNLSDQESLKVKSIYPMWISMIGKQLPKNHKVTYNGSLYKAINDIDEVKEEENPKESLDLYEEIIELHSGDKNDPIKYKSGIVFELGKYYTQNGVVYICFKDSTLVVEDDITKYLGIYVSIA